MTYRIVRRFFNRHETQIIEQCLTLDQAKKHCKDPETSSKTCSGVQAIQLTLAYGPWFDGYEEESEYAPRR